MKRATRARLIVRNYVSISSPITHFKRRISTIYAVGEKRYGISERSAIFIIVGARAEGKSILK